MSLDFSFLCKVKGLTSKVILKLNVAKSQFSFFFLNFQNVADCTQSCFVQLVHSLPLRIVHIRSSAPPRQVGEPLVR